MKKQLTLSAAFVWIMFSFISCHSKPKNTGPVFINSQVYPSIACFADTSVKYAVCLPPDYTIAKPSPVLILFDSHGNGMLPVNLFKDHAAKNGFILVGSNNSKNGMTVEQTNSIFRYIRADLFIRFNIKSNAVYLGGFSGGSRVAGAAAIMVGGVAGVVGCGAGLPNTENRPPSTLSYLGVVGNQDFNYTEMKQLDQSLEQAGYDHHLLIFDGIHQWPPKETIKDVFSWLRFDEMKEDTLLRNRAEINRFIENNDKIAQDFAKAGNPVKQQDTYIKMLHFLQGLTSVTPLQVEIKNLANDKQVMAYKEQQTKLLETEQNLQKEYSPDLQKQDVNWWTKEASRLRSLTESKENPEMNAVYKRVLGFLSLNCYMYSTSALKQNNIEDASKYIELYRLVDPTNSEHRYLAAEVAAINHRDEAVFKDLKDAFKLGFNDTNRMKADVYFKAFLQDERFKKLFSGQVK